MKRIALIFCEMIFMTTAVIAFAQTLPEKKPSFEVASVKLNNSGSPGSSVNLNGGSFRATNVILRQLIVQSYRLLNSQLIGGPDWINAERFDIEAKSGDGAIPPAENATANARAEMTRQMIQSVLEDRFVLKVHRETKELPVFLLTVAKDGAKLQRTIEGHAGPGGLRPGSSRTNRTSTGIEVSASGITMEGLVSMLAVQTGRPVTDATNLTGTYDFSLKFAPSPAPAGGLDSSPEPIGPSLFTAIQEQLGLKLEATRGPIEVLVIDSVQRPTDN